MNNNIDLAYNTNLCQICQIPDNLDIVGHTPNPISKIFDDGRNYLDLLKYIFQDISWTDESQISVACYSCLKRIRDTAEFKTMCLNANNRRSLLNVTDIKLEIITNDDSPEVDTTVKIEEIYFQCPSPNIDTTKEESDPKPPEKIKRKRPNWRKKSNDEFKPTKVSMEYQCNICNTKLGVLQKFERHMNKHNGSRNYTCNICSRTFITKSDLQAHLYRHSAKPTHACKICPDKKFKCAKDLGKHMVVNHTNKEEYKYQCTHCGMKCSQLSVLKMHIIRAHTKVRNFKCDVCNYAFLTKRDLKNHYTTHSDIREFQCDYCPTAYKRKSLLQTHKTKQHGIGSYKVQIKEKLDCTYCRMKIAKDKLPRHIRSHTGSKPFSCRLCGMKFICKSYIRGHLRSKHDIDVESPDYDTKHYYDMIEEVPLKDAAAVEGGDKV